MGWFTADVTAQYSRVRHQEWCHAAEQHNQAVSNTDRTVNSVERKPRLRLAAGLTHLIAWMK